MVKLAALLLLVMSLPAYADETPDVRPGALIGIQQTDRTAWVFGPSLEVRIYDDFSIRGEAHLELGDIDDPFGPSNIRGGTGPHVNHVMFGPSWRPKRYAQYGLAAGASAGVLVMHSTFADPIFAKKPAAGVFVQAGRMLGPVSLALQVRLDVSASIPMAGPNGESVPTTSLRFNLAFEVPIELW